MKKIGLLGLALAAPAGLLAVESGRAADAPTPSISPVNCRVPDAPYKNYDCLDKYLGDGFFERLVNYYRLEWGHEAAPSDPKAPPARREGWPGQPQTTPPMPFTEWPYGGATSIGVTRPNAVDSPLMVALANTELGKWMNDCHFQVYGWVNPGGNLSTSSVTPGGSFPAAYAFSPNTAQLDQVVVYFERVPDTVQTDHIDWGFRFSGLYGETYRYTTTYGIASYQLLGHNLFNGFDMPMMWGELYIPYVAEGMLLRLGRFISIPDIEAQLAPNNYMYSHSLTYGYDNYTNHGLMQTTALTKNWFLETGVVIGTDTAPWHWGQRVNNPFPNPTYPDNTYLKDPGAKPSFTAAVRWQSDSGYDSIYLTADGLNNGVWGYNNLQWLGGTYYHKFNEQWHLSFETYTLSQRHVLNALDPANAAVLANNGWPYNPTQRFRLQRAEPRPVRQYQRAGLHGAHVHRAVLPELQPDQARQHLAARRVLQRHERPAHLGEDPLCLRRSRLAALVLAPGRAASRGRLVSLARRQCVQRQLQCRAQRCHGDPAQSELRRHRVDGPDLALLIG